MTLETYADGAVCVNMIFHRLGSPAIRGVFKRRERKKKGASLDAPFPCIHSLAWPPKSGLTAAA